MERPLCSLNAVPTRSADQSFPHVLRAGPCSNPQDGGEASERTAFGAPRTRWPLASCREKTGDGAIRMLHGESACRHTIRGPTTEVRSMAAQTENVFGWLFTQRTQR